MEITALKGKSLRKQRRKIGMIFQQFHLFASRNVYENVAYPLKHQGLTRQEIKKRVEELLNLVGLEDKASAYPSQLSGEMCIRDRFWCNLFQGCVPSFKTYSVHFVN